MCKSILQGYGHHLNIGMMVTQENGVTFTMQYKTDECITVYIETGYIFTLILLIKGMKSELPDLPSQ